MTSQEANYIAQAASRAHRHFINAAYERIKFEAMQGNFTATVALPAITANRKKLINSLYDNRYFIEPFTNEAEYVVIRWGQKKEEIRAM